MKILQILLLLFVIGNTNSSFSQNLLSNKDLISDVDNYRNSISSKHKNPFTKISKKQFNQKIDSLISLIPFIDKERFTVELFKINSFIEDEHTILFPDFKIELPLKFELFDEGMTIIASDSVNQKYLSHRIVAINNNSWSKIDSLYKTIIKRDNPAYFKFFENLYFSNPEILKGFGIIKELRTMQFQLLSPQGDTINATINSVAKSSKKNWKYAQPFKNLLAYSKNSNYWYNYDEKSKTLYFNYQRCQEDKNESFKKFNAKLFKTIQEVNPNKIILDVRFNGGGNSGVLKPFIKSIKKSKLNINGKFFVLIGRRVMSSSLMNVIELKKTTNAIFVGEQTGGNVNHFGELKDFELVHSKIKVKYSTKYWENWKNHSGAFKPDIETSNLLLDFLKSYDKALEISIEK